MIWQNMSAHFLEDGKFEQMRSCSVEMKWGDSPKGKRYKQYEINIYHRYVEGRRCEHKRVYTFDTVNKKIIWPHESIKRTDGIMIYETILTSRARILIGHCPSLATNNIYPITCEESELEEKSISIPHQKETRRRQQELLKKSSDKPKDRLDRIVIV